MVTGSGHVTRRLSRSVKTGLVVVGVLALLAGTLRYVFNPRNLERYTAMELRLDKLRFMNRALDDQNRVLAREIEYCRHDPRYLERVARFQLHQIRDGDTVYVFPPAAGAAPGTGSGGDGAAAAGP
jgi:cell division protein FtsB